MFCKNINIICSHSFQMKCLIIFMYVRICFVENSKSAETGRLSFQVSRTYLPVTFLSTPEGGGFLLLYVIYFSKNYT
jgi:hypothetical protein